MQLFNKLRKLTAQRPGAVQDTDNAFDNSNRIIEAVVRHLRPLAGISGNTELHFWLDEAAGPILPMLIDNDDFRLALSAELYEQCLESFAKKPFVVHTEPMPEGLQRKFDVQNGLTMTLGPVPDSVRHESLTTVQSAWLRLIDGHGNALQPDMQLIPAQNKNRWKIGRGSEHIGSSSIRRNDYVVNDLDPEGSGGAVSRAHCDIIYRDGNFYIQACPGGCRLEGGAATKICRASSDRIEELHSSTLQRVLQPGDIIELGRSVMIRFEA